MQLVIAEKPSVASTIATVLGANKKEKSCYKNDKYIISWCVGHLVGLAIPDSYSPLYAQQPWKFENLPIIPSKWLFEVNKATKAQFYVLKELMSRNEVTEIVCATDAGREGECIFRYIYNKIGCKKPVKRLWTSSLEGIAIKKGFEQLKPDYEYDNIYNAGLARAKADWLVGINATRLFSVKYKSALSIGRVQTPTLAMVVERYKNVKNFIKEKYYTVDLNCGDFAAVSGRIDDEKTAKELQSNTNNAQAFVKSVKEEIKTVEPPKLYDLTTLQREANRIYGFTAQQTLDYTQALYEKKLCTYPRTDSNYITDDMEQTALSVIDVINQVFSDFQIAIQEPNVKRCINNKKVSDHHALLPTVQIKDCDLQILPSGELKILKLMSIRLLTAVSSPNKYKKQSVSIISRGAYDKIFTVTAKSTIDKGFKAFEDIINNKDTSRNEKNLTVYEGQNFENVSSVLSEHFTSPPRMYTEDTLLAAMETAGNSNYDENSEVEKKGLGTSATRARIIENLVQRNYISREKKNLVPTDNGIKLIQCVPDEVKSAKMTADWETKLQNIEKGLGSVNDFLFGIEDYVKQLIHNYAQEDTNALFKREYECVGICPKCGKRILAYNKAYSCENNKNCGFIIWKNISGKEITITQAKKLIENRKTDLLKGFKSKNGKDFSAYIVLNGENNTEFKFPSKRK